MTSAKYSFTIEEESYPLKLGDAEIVITGPQSRFDLNQLTGFVEFTYGPESERITLNKEKVALIQPDSSLLVISRHSNS